MEKRKETLRNKEEGISGEKEEEDLGQKKGRKP